MNGILCGFLAIKLDRAASCVASIANGQSDRLGLERLSGRHGALKDHCLDIVMVVNRGPGVVVRVAITSQGVWSDVFSLSDKGTVGARLGELDASHRRDGRIKLDVKGISEYSLVDDHIVEQRWREHVVRVCIHQFKAGSCRRSRPQSVRANTSARGAAATERNRNGTGLNGSTD